MLYQPASTRGGRPDMANRKTSNRQDAERNTFLRGYFGAEQPVLRMGNHDLLVDHEYDLNDLDAECYNFGELTICRMRFAAGSSITGRTGSDACYLQLVVFGEYLMSTGSQMLELQQGCSTVLNPNTQRYAAFPRDCELMIVRMPRTNLMQAALEFGFIQTGQDILFQSRVMDQQQSGSLFHLLQAIMMQLHQPVAGNAGDYYCRLLSLAMLRGFPANIADARLSRPSTNTQIETVRAHVLRHITEDFDIEHLASLCHVSTKTLYNIFNRELGITPASYIRQIKLEAIYQELSNGEHIRNVTEIAIRYGFTNLSRFSNQYKQLFGELPSATLKSARKLPSI